MRKFRNKFIREATKEDLGSDMKVGTNSEFNIDLDTGKRFDFEKLGELVTIISYPFTLKLRRSGKGARLMNYSFVVVLYKGNVYRLLNYFQK